MIILLQTARCLNMHLCAIDMPNVCSPPVYIAPRSLLCCAFSFTSVANISIKRCITSGTKTNLQSICGLSLTCWEEQKYSQQIQLLFYFFSLFFQGGVWCGGSSYWIYIPAFQLLCNDECIQLTVFLISASLYPHPNHPHYLSFPTSISLFPHSLTN